MDKDHLQAKLRQATVLAPLTRGGNLPFRRLCVDFGAEITLSEMAFARKLIKGDRKERALLKRHPSEKCYGVQIAARKPDEAVQAGKIVEESGADFIDLNCGCPIFETTRRGLGASLLEKPNAIAAMVEALCKELTIPVTVKIRTGMKASKINAKKVTEKVESAGAAAVTIHGRTKEQRYSKSADWELIAEIAHERSIPIIGNGDIVSFEEANYHREHHGVKSLMLARGVLIKPWLFQEIAEEREMYTSAEERVEIYFRLSQYLKEHFGDDELGNRRIMQFFPWHFSFFHRWGSFAAAPFEPNSETPRIHNRDLVAVEDSTLASLLAHPDETLHQEIASRLLASQSVTDALEGLTALSKTREDFVSASEDSRQSREERFAAG